MQVTKVVNSYSCKMSGDAYKEFRAAGGRFEHARYDPIRDVWHCCGLVEDGTLCRKTVNPTSDWDEADDWDDNF